MSRATSIARASRLPRNVARSAVALPAALLLALGTSALAAPASAGSSKAPEVIDIAPVNAPEGITAGPGSTFYAGDREGGNIVVGNVRTGKVAPFVSREDGVAVGLFYDAPTQRLWVAGGPTGTITAYDTRTGKEVFVAKTGGGFLNDVVVTREAVYVTDSTTNEIYVVPLDKSRSLPAAGTFEVLPVTGDYVQPAGFGLNGIRVLPGGDLVVTSGGVLYAVDPDTGVADTIQVRGGPLTGGDGLVLKGNLLSVVRGYGDRDSVVQVKLDKAAGTGTVVGELTDPDFQTPTTAAYLNGDLYAVNGQFDMPGTATEVVRVDGS